MKILHTGDWHLGQFKGPVADGVNLRSLDTKKCLEEMVEMARNMQPDIVVISGDIFHQEQVGPTRYSDEMVTAFNIINDLGGIAKQVIVMRGTPNHDGAGQFRVLTEMFKSYEDVQIVTTPQIIKTPMCDIACIPGFDKQEFRAKYPGLSSEEENLVWTEYISQMVTGLRAGCDFGKPAILMAHYTVPGCNMESGQTSFFTNFEPVIPREALQVANFDGVLLGHIHRPQQITGLRNVFYSGAINAMNFNDEGQPRGFYLHTYPEEMGRAEYDPESAFFTTPYRKFKTITWNTDDVDAYLNLGELALQDMDVTDKIVRVRFSCTTEQKKALNVPKLQKDLTNIGAFYVSDIEPETTVDYTNRGLLAEENDPLANLKQWLDEKRYQNSDKIVELAEPIIAEAMKQSTTAKVFGVFKPISIAVKNYRNYKEESFDFADISFCTINGVNGAGKSSLFMDAIVDCLFEETREGDSKAWIRGTEDARSGSIEFVFEIGDSRFRVVRTRTKSGRPTLNLSQMNEDGTDWVNISKEKIVDTQAEIEKVLGMDSMTFRSCALIMQDQYGLFLQAKKDERMAILGNLLGLGIYGIMEDEARKNLKTARGQLMGLKEQERVKADIIQSKGNPESQIATIDAQIEKYNAEVALKEKELADLNLLETQRGTAVKEYNDLAIEIGGIRAKKASISNDIFTVDGTITACAAKLADAESIKTKAHIYEAAEKRLQELTPDVDRYKLLVNTSKTFSEEATAHQNALSTLRKRNAYLESVIAQKRAQIRPDTAEKVEELKGLRAEREQLLKAKELYESILRQKADAISAHYQEVAKIGQEQELAQQRLDACRNSEKFLADSGCPDIESASCKFLAQAKENVAMIPDLESRIQNLKTQLASLDEAQEVTMATADKALAECGYDENRYKDIVTQIKHLELFEKLAEQERSLEVEIASLTAEHSTNNTNISETSEKAERARQKATEANTEMLELTEIVREYNETVSRMREYKIFVTQASELPVWEERLRNANARKAELAGAIAELDAQILEKEPKVLEAMTKMNAFGEDNSFKIMDLEATVLGLRNDINGFQMRKGGLLQMVEDIKTLSREIEEIRIDISKAAETADRYDILKSAFSQDGVPHQITRNVIPHITDAANNILGQMTGGHMGVEFVMERTVKGKDGDKATLDVLINEYGKTTLPYASKSGGEKVKASLAVILALAEIKTSAAGIQLGMLFIDEPPFLDDDGAQAYVDSLETIRERYPDVKIMAITHDDAMKARFVQSVTVIKTDEGSKVIY